MDKNVFLPGVCDKYPEMLLKNRVQIEGNVIGVLWSEPMLISDYNLKSSEFVTKDGRFFYSLAKILREKHRLSEFDEAAVVTHLSSDAIEKLNDRGGYSAIRNIMDISNTRNAPSYIDTLNKSNLFLKLHSSGFPVTSEVDDGSGNKIIPFKHCQNFDCQGVSDWFDSLLVKLSKDEGHNSKVIEEKLDFTITDELLENLEEGQLVGTSFGYIDDTNVKGDPIRVFPWLDSEVCSLRHKTTTALCGYSSTGKSMLLCEVMLALISNGEKVCIVSNEMDSTPYYLNFISFLAYRKFRYTHLTRSKLQSGDLNDEDKNVLAQVKKYFNENFAKYIVFYQITDSDIQLVKRKVKYAALELGCTVFWYDTMKADISDYNKDQPNYLSLIRDSREIDALAKKYDLIAIVSMQISSATKGRAWIDEGTISQSKQVIEVMENCWMLRNCYGAPETDQNGRYYLNPFQRKKKDGKWVKEPYMMDSNANYKVLFITKNRAGSNSESTGECLLLKADTHIATFHEEAWCTPSRAFIGATTN